MAASPHLSAPRFAEPARAANGVSFVSVPRWEQIPWLWHAFSTRQGGVSRAYTPEGAPGELNLGFTADDDRENVLHNRRLLAEAVTGDPATPIVTVRQVHSAVIVVTGAGDQAQPLCEGDGLITNQPGILLGIQTADCVPVLVADRNRRVVAAIHAGWRGTAQGIVENAIARILQKFGSDPRDLVAAIGPAIGPCCYTVGEEVLAEFQSRFAYAGDLFQQAGPTPRLDLFEANRRQLLSARLDPGSISLAGGCTACQPRLFFSHRASQGRAGRMLSVIGIGVPAGGSSPVG
jgi:YfiH family protein